MKAILYFIFLFALMFIGCYTLIDLISLITGFGNDVIHLYGIPLLIPLLCYVFSAIRKKFIFKDVKPCFSENIFYFLPSAIFVLYILKYIGVEIQDYNILILYSITLFSSFYALSIVDKEYEKRADARNKKELEIIKKREEFIDKVINGDNYIFNKLPTVIADIKAKDYELVVGDVGRHRNILYEAKSLREKYREAVIELRKTKYKLEKFIFDFPQAEDYIEDFVVQEEYDNTRLYLSDEEYKKLTQGEKSQLQLDRHFKKRSKSQIGADYEFCCARVLENCCGYKVEEHGAKYGVHDQGRDLICFDDKNNTIYIVQCKYWSKNNEIKENVIMQLYGTAVAYKIIYNKTANIKRKIIPVLMMPPSSVISETAKSYIELLEIEVWKQKLLDNIPVIKCNINNGDKIYHLPFDQQYRKAMIDKPGEFYAYTVAEAEAAGFRRAMRHFITN